MSYPDLPSWEVEARAAYRANLEASGPMYGDLRPMPVELDFHECLRRGQAHAEAQRRLAATESKALNPHP